MAHLFISDEEFSRHSNDAAFMAEKADAFIKGLYSELETVRAQADAASITAEQTCSLLDQKFLSLSAEFSDLQSQNAQLQTTLELRLSELAEVKSQKHQLNLLSIGKDGEIERLNTELSELHKSKRQLMELIEQKDLEIGEKDATIKSYLDKIVNLSETAAQREARLSEVDMELVRSRAEFARLSQEKELIERHNVWLNDELTAKVGSIIEQRRVHSDVEVEMSAKVRDVERKLDECSNALKWNKDSVKELEMKLTSAQEELCLSRKSAAENEERLCAEISTINKLVELYKESSEEWSKKATELEGVIKALETHLNQVESDYKEKLAKEESQINSLEEEATALKMKLEKCEAEIELSRKKNELTLFPLGSFASDGWIHSKESSEVVDDNHKLDPKLPIGVSGTALAASLLRDGWSLAKMYAKYQETVDAFRHEQMGRKEAEAVLQRVLYELEDKAEVILEERAEHERMIESYSLLNQKLQNSISEQAILEKTIKELKADLKIHERDYMLIQRENVDLSKQVSILLKECRDVQLRCGYTGHDVHENLSNTTSFDMNVESDADRVISEYLLTFKDINGLVEQNVQLRSLVRKLSVQIQDSELDFKEKMEVELKRHTQEAASKVEAVLQKVEEQGQMIESLHASVAMYKRLYEEEHKRNVSHPLSAEVALDSGRRELEIVSEDSQEGTKAAQKQTAKRVRYLEEELEKSRSEINLVRAERNKFELASSFTKEKLDSFMKEFEQQRVEMNGVLARNVEFSQLIVDYQRKLREVSESLQSADEQSRKLTMEVSVLKTEKELLSNAEKRAQDEVRNLSERLFRVQASLDTIQSVEEVHEEARVAERRKLEEHAKQLEREWAELKKELQEERDNVRTLTLDREKTLKNAMGHVEEMGKELSNALHATAAAEARAAISEAKLSELEKKISSSDNQVVDLDERSGLKSQPSNQVGTDLHRAEEQIQKFKEEAQACKDHMLQYKNIAQVNEEALKQMECAHETFKIEADKMKKSLEADLLQLRGKVSELENESILKSQELACAANLKEEAIASSLGEIRNLSEENAAKSSKIQEMEIQISYLKEDLERELQKWRAAQANYERQVILQSETIQELTKTSQALASVQEEAAELRKLADAYKRDHDELKAKWEERKLALEDFKNKADKEYTELNEQNKILLIQLEAFHIRSAEEDRKMVGVSSESNAIEMVGDAGLQSVIRYLRRTKEIAETEISLLKQDKLRLQSQVENALKAAESAQTSLHAERQSSKALLLTEEEIKSLQLQVREMNLLRESNIQLREENKHNFEECQKLREEFSKAKIEIEKFEGMLRMRQIEMESCKMEIESQKADKVHLESKVSELLERSKNIDYEDYIRVKDDVQRMQMELNEKDSEIEKVKMLLTERQESLSQLERDLSNCRFELKEREKKVNDIQHIEANLRADMEKQKKFFAQYKRKFETVSKEKDELVKENQALSKQLEDIKQVNIVGKRSGGDSTGEQAIEEKDTKIQILEKHLERLREELKREKDDSRTEKNRRLRIEKAIKDSYTIVEQEKSKILNELGKHRGTMKQLSDELEKLRQSKSSPPEDALVQPLSGIGLDDLASTYVLAVENFEKTVQSVLTDLGAQNVPSEVSVATDALLQTSTGSDASFQTSDATLPVAPVTTNLPAKALEESEKKGQLSRTKVETRKAGRKLVRPRLGKPEGPQGDIDMSMAELPNNENKRATSGKSETEGEPTPSTHQLARKRVASSTSELHEHSTIPGETSTEMAAPVMKKAKGSDTLPEDVGGPSSTSLGSLKTQPPLEEVSDVCEFPQGLNEEAVDVEKEVEILGEKADRPKELSSDGSMSHDEIQTDRKETLDENLDRQIGAEVSDDGLKDQAEPDNWNLTSEIGSEREEGELAPEVTDLEGGNNIENIEIGEDHIEAVATPDASPSGADDDALAVTAMEIGEINSPEIQNEEKNDDGDITDETAEILEKSTDCNQIDVESDQAVETTSMSTENVPSTPPETNDPKQGSPTVVKRSSPVSSSTSTTINLQERAKERAMLRQAGVVSSLDRRPVRGLRGRGGRTERGGRGQRSGRGGPAGESNRS
ncbi:nuclear-pore anchor isoform X2 [Momordica charantia]|uniref:Nuclear-pore anchor isoform X2 n=1 Tax=Momordica charantia TaxID=3673 RepID=A0A6J1CLF4_MOMCH|nr:nuclear-pore anchor isoform X2 [Momordica charantia]